MKIAIASEGAGPGSRISQHAARAPYYLLYDEGGKLEQAVSNPCAGAERGAGPKAAYFLAQMGVKTVVAGEFGRRFEEELAEGEIRFIQKTGTVSEVIAEILAE